MTEFIRVFKKLFRSLKSTQSLILKLDMDRCIFSINMFIDSRDLNEFEREYCASEILYAGGGRTGVKGVVPPLGFHEGFFSPITRMCVFLEVAVMHF